MTVGLIEQSCVRLVDERDGDQCQRCGRTLGLWWSRQHRQARGRGGSKRWWVRSPANRAKVCGSATSPDGCHLAIESRESRDQAEFEGWWISLHSTADPATVPLRLYGDRWVYLLHDGTRQDLTDEQITDHYERHGR